MKCKESWLHSSSTQHAFMQMGNFAKKDAPFQAFTNQPSCIMALYAKNDQEIGVQCTLFKFHKLPAFPPIVIMSNLWIFILTPTMQGLALTMICLDKAINSSLFQQLLHILKLPPNCSATSRHFHLLPHNEDPVVAMHVPLDGANLNRANISIPDFHIWQHFDSNWTTPDMQKMVDIPEIPIAQFHMHMIDQGWAYLTIWDWQRYEGRTLSYM